MGLPAQRLGVPLWWGKSYGTFSPPVATEGAAFSNVTVFHFTDADPAASIATSFPGFADLMRGLGAKIEVVG